mmetsp:Transcript_23088/g.74313  ORF Transcript_23088/g.74313 Transcript_23088/m.74313 type:complete len:250 (-) Transcript_23088:322-1071(-)
MSFGEEGDAVIAVDLEDLRFEIRIVRTVIRELDVAAFPRGVDDGRLVEVEEEGTADLIIDLSPSVGLIMGHELALIFRDELALLRPLQQVRAPPVHRAPTDGLRVSFDTLAGKKNKEAQPHFKKRRKDAGRDDALASSFRKHAVVATGPFAAAAEVGVALAAEADAVAHFVAASPRTAAAAGITVRTSQIAAAELVAKSCRAGTRRRAVARVLAGNVGRREASRRPPFLLAERLEEGSATLFGKSSLLR